MGQHQSGYTPNYDAPVSFVTASNPVVTPEASKSFALAQRAAQALGNDPRVRMPSPPRAADEWERQQREIQQYEQQRLAGHVEVYSSGPAPPPPPGTVTDPAAAAAAGSAPPPPPPDNGMDADDGDPLLEGLMNEAF